MDEMALIRLGKSYKGVLCFEGKYNNFAFKVLAFRPIDEEGLTIPGVTVEIHLRVGLTADRCKYTFTLFHLSKQKKRRIYQLEVVPKSKRSHNGPPRLYGPHEHFGDTDTRSVQAISTAQTTPRGSTFLRQNQPVTGRGDALPIW